MFSMQKRMKIHLKKKSGYVHVKTSASGANNYLSRRGKVSLIERTNF